MVPEERRLWRVHDSLGRITVLRRCSGPARDYASVIQVVSKAVRTAQRAKVFNNVTRKPADRARLVFQLCRKANRHHEQST